LFGSVIAGLILAALWDIPTERWWAGSSPNTPMAALWIVGMALVLGAVSFWDDRGGLPVTVRFGMQLIAASVVVIWADVTIPSIAIPAVGDVQLGWVAVPVAVVFLLWMTNLYNFMDGMDGFAGGMTVLGFGCMAYFSWQSHHSFILILSLVISTGAAGFLVYNLPPARIFMGDVGSIPLGFLSGSLILLGVHDGLFDIWVPLLVFSPFVLDATATLVRRVLRRERVWEAHRSHYYQRLVLHGWGHRKTLLSEYGLMLLCMGAALVYRSASDPWRLAVLVTWAAVFVAIGLWVRLIEQRAGRS
jgi:UDP-N-acetylmuramyl pentapeptide phosphotransferase/UDP-N-acetylglucosamine-1-phosphate transferase